MRLIDADELLKTLKGMFFHGQLHHHFDNDKVAHNRAIYDASEQIKKAPTIELNTVTHAKWIRFRNDDDELVVRCSHCHEVWHVADTESVDLVLDDLLSDDMIYCPSCGAKMDGDQNDAT